MTKIHLDTDIGGDMDDMCALALLLKWHNLEITGVTTTAEENGRRAGYARYMLDMMGRTEVPVAAGADCADGYYRYPSLEYPPDEENWPEKIAPRPGSVDDAIELLKRSIEQGAIVVGIGPFTNFRLLDEKYPGILRQAKLFLMGGYVYPIPQGYPQWDNHVDWNIQVDVPSAQYVLEHANPTLIPVAVTFQTALRRAYLPRIAQAGKLGALIARQAELFARMNPHDPAFAVHNFGLPADIINYQHDPLACAIALGWRVGVGIESIALKLEVRDGWLHEIPANEGIVTPVVTRVNAPVFNVFWLDLICW